MGNGDGRVFFVIGSKGIQVVVGYIVQFWSSWEICLLSELLNQF